MEVREATEEDIPAIVNLLKLSLGESLMPKSEQYWRWKHIVNPFGVSPVLLCWDSGQLVGVRAFMRWEWIQNGKLYRTVRAVDTATHPEFQGKGVFKKLTLALVSHCKQRGDQFVFNTPNEHSKPGYVKMGWREAGRVPVYGSIQKPFSLLRHLISYRDTKINENETSSNSLTYYLQNDSLYTLLTDHHERINRLMTNTSVPYLSWRYVTVPVAKYVAIGQEKHGELKGLIIARIKQSRLGRELRITDCFLRGNCDGKELMKNFDIHRQNWRVDYTTFTGTIDGHTKKLFSGLNFRTSMGPLVTVRSLEMTDLNLLMDFHHWSPSLGDLELF